MKRWAVLGAVLAVAGSSQEVGALDRALIRGDDGLSALTQAVLDNCTSLHSLGDPIGYVGSGSADGLSIMTSGSNQCNRPAMDA